MIFSIIPPQAKIGMAVVAAVTCFYLGWTVHGWKFDAQIKNQQDDFIAAAHRTDESNRKIIQGFQNDISKLQSKKIDRDARIPLVTDGRICFANSDALQLWNEALSSKPDVPKSSAGAAKDSARPSITDDDILRNINENGQRWQELRLQMNKIILWDTTTFGPR